MRYDLNALPEIYQSLAQRVDGVLVEGDPPPSNPPVERPEYHDRVCFRLGAVGFAFFSSFTGRQEVGPGIADVVYTRLVVTGSYRQVPDFHIVPETVWARLTKWFGAQDIDAGDSDYDAAFIMKCSDPRWLRQLLTPGFRRAHLQCPKTIVRLLNGRLEAMHDHLGKRSVDAVVQRAEALAALHHELGPPDG
ncbi:MAG: hypothetical protein AAGA56_19805 [Myxococcota bacterium]